MQNMKPDLLVAWNIRYDINYLVNMVKTIDYDVSKFSPEGRIIENCNEVIEIPGVALVDLMDLYKRIASTRAYSLESVAKEERLPILK